MGVEVGADDSEQADATSVREQTPSAPQAAAPAPGKVAPGQGAPGQGAPGGPFDRRLIAACIGLWVVAVIVFALQAPRMLLNYRLGNLRIALAERDHEGAAASIKALLERGPALVEAVRGELLADPEAAARGEYKPQPVSQVYRLTMIVEVLGKIPGPEATDLILLHRHDEDDSVRTNVYSTLAERVRDGKTTGERADQVRTVVREAVTGDASPLARAFAARALFVIGKGSLEDPAQQLPVAWALIVGVRELPEPLLGLTAPLISALQLALGKDLPFDPTATPEQRDQQLLAFEEAYRAAGGQIPAGEDLRAWRAKHPIQPAPAPGSAPGSAPGPGNGAPGAASPEVKTQ